MALRYNVGDMLMWPTCGGDAALVVRVIDGGSAVADVIAVNILAGSSAVAGSSMITTPSASYDDVPPPAGARVVSRVEPPYDPSDRVYSAGEYVVYSAHPVTDAGRVVDVLDGGSMYLVQTQYGKTVAMARPHIRRVASNHEKRRFIVRFNNTIDNCILRFAKCIEDCESHRIRE